MRYFGTKKEACDLTANNHMDVFAQIQEETQKYLNGENLRIAMDLLAYLKESGRTWTFEPGGHPEFYYMGELNCLFAYMKSPMDDATVAHVRKLVEDSGNRWVYDPSSSWNICCWQNDGDLYEPGDFPVSEDLKDFAREYVWKCIRCGGCSTPGGEHRAVFGKTFDNACVNLFQFANPTDEMLAHIIKLMELQKRIIAISKETNP